MGYTYKLSSATDISPVFLAIGQALGRPNAQTQINDLLSLWARDIDGIDALAVDWVDTSNHEIVLECTICGHDYDLVLHPDFENGFDDEWVSRSDVHDSLECRKVQSIIVEFLSCANVQTLWS